MKATKKILLSVLALALVLTVVLGAVACQSTPDKDTEIVITVDSSVMPDISGKTVGDYLLAMKEQKLITFEASETQYGLFITSMNGRAAGDGEWWAFYTDDTENETNANIAYGSYVAKDGKTYAMTGLGVSSFPLKEGKTYVFVLQKY